MARICSRPSSVIFSGPHGGIQTQLILKASTTPSNASAVCSSTFRHAVSSGKDNSIIANADVYEGPFGKVMVHPNRVMATSAAVAHRRARSVCSAVMPPA